MYEQKSCCCHSSECSSTVRKHNWFHMNPSNKILFHSHRNSRFYLQREHPPGTPRTNKDCEASKLGKAGGAGQTAANGMAVHSSLAACKPTAKEVLLQPVIQGGFLPGNCVGEEDYILQPMVQKALGAELAWGRWRHIGR